MGHLSVPAVLHLDATVLCHADNPQMCNSSLLPELQTHIQLPNGYISTWMWPRGTSNSCEMEHTFLPRAAPVSCLNSWYHQTWEFSLILLPPLSSHIFHQSLKTIIIDSTLPPGLLTLPSSGRHSSPAPLQQLYRHLLPASSSSDPSSTRHWGRGSLWDKSQQPTDT